MSSLIKAYGGDLVNLLVTGDRADTLRVDSEGYISVTLTQRQYCDLELLLNGGLSPLTGFMTQMEYNSVIAEMRLPNNLLWAIPIVLDVDEAVAESLEKGVSIGLRDPEGFMLAVLHIEDIWKPDKNKEASAIYGQNR